jgi:hypothetical protein
LYRVDEDEAGGKPPVKTGWEPSAPAPADHLHGQEERCQLVREPEPGASLPPRRAGRFGCGAWEKSSPGRRACQGGDLSRRSRVSRICVTPSVSKRTRRGLMYRSLSVYATRSLLLWKLPLPGGNSILHEKLAVPVGLRAPGLAVPARHPSRPPRAGWDALPRWCHPNQKRRPQDASTDVGQSYRLACSSLFNRLP